MTWKRAVKTPKELRSGEFDEIVIKKKKKIPKVFKPLRSGRVNLEKKCGVSRGCLLKIQQTN